MSPSILSDIEKFAEFNSEVIFQIRAKMAEVSTENFMHGRLQAILSPENCFCGMAVSNWCSSSIYIQPF